MPSQDSPNGQTNYCESCHHVAHGGNYVTFVIAVISIFTVFIAIYSFMVYQKVLKNHGEVVENYCRIVKGRCESVEQPHCEYIQKCSWFK